jgi:hypothetical protein
MKRAMTLRALALAPVLDVVLAVAGCGDSASDSTTTGSGTTTSTSTSTSGGGTTADDAKAKCLEAASGISDAKAKSIAEQGCDSLASNPQITEALVKAKQKCLEAAAKIPVASVQSSAVEACNKIN